MLFLGLHSETHSPACVNLENGSLRAALLTVCGSLKADCNSGCALSMRLTASVAHVNGICPNVQQVLGCHLACQTRVACGAGNYKSKGVIFLSHGGKCSVFKCCFTEWS